ncbi:MAG TPA: hypothetical protein VEC19_05260 [Usitatibacter sp.]|nr:hypothetical protein [Usitatibacter sp.]
MSSAPPDTETGASLPFADARGCREWLAGLPLTNLAQSQATLLGGLRRLNAGSFAGMERLKSLELMRDKVALLMGEQRASFFGKAVPLPPNDASNWLTGRGLLDEMEAGYRRALEACATEPELARHAALVSQRIVRYISSQLLYHALVYRRFEPARLARLHDTYAQAQAAGRHEERVKDSLEADEAGSSVAEAYAHALLLAQAGLSALRPAEIDFAAALARLWTRKVKVAAGSLEDVAGLAMSVRKRIHALNKDESATELGLPAAAPEVDVLAMLLHLHARWCEPAAVEAGARPPAEKAVGLVFGGPEIHFFLSGGKVFEQPDRKRELTAREKQDIEVFGRVTERTQSMMLTEHNFTVEKWEAMDEMLGAWRLMRPAASARSMAVGKLAAMRAGDAAPFFLGMVSGLVLETDGRMVVTLTLFPGKPEAIAVRAGDARNRSNAKWSQGFSLPAMEKLKVPATLLLPAGMAHRGRGVEVWEGEPKEKTVYEIVKRGSDFDRITIF